MAATAYDDTVEFLFRHPWATNESDNPVTLLRELEVEHDAALAEIDELTASLDAANEELRRSSPDTLRLVTHQLDELLAFARGLRDAEKISDVEYQHARAIAKRVPPHRAEPSTTSSSASSDGKE